MPIFAAEMAKQFTDTEEVLRMINQRLRKLEKSDSGGQNTKKSLTH